jgi:murein DD-endopeptidase MepM/ murein hydrolase activator NlpD
MEIISYVGASCPSGARRRPVSFRLPERKFRFSGAALRSCAVHTADSVRNFASYSWLIPAFLVCAVIPATVINITKHIENRTGPVALKSVSSSDMELLDKAMSHFALEQDGDDFDENGNVLADDGTVLTAASVGVGQKVTFSTYKVQSGDTISTIARRAGLTNISTLIAVNDIDNVRSLRAGQKLRVPSLDGIVHTVSAKQSLNSISVLYHTSVEELCDANDLESRILRVGQELFIPGAKLDSASLRKAMGEFFMTPLSAGWRLTSHFGTRPDPFTGVSTYHTGVDMAAPTGTPIKAAMSGRIAYVGWSNVFGNYVIINHGNGYQTLYGHMSKTLAHVGEEVSQGTRIGLVGSTGYSTGPHLHFTVYKNGRLIDPLTLLK